MRVVMSMGSLSFGPFMRCVGAAAVLCAIASGPVAASDAPVERVALMLSGEDCTEQRDQIRAALTELSVVKRVDFETVPDHVLVDLEAGHMRPELLQEAVRQRLGDGSRCRAEVMKSCISANLVSSSP